MLDRAIHDHGYILVVEDDSTLGQLIKTMLEYDGFRAAVAPTAELALAIAAQAEPRLLWLDLSLPDRYGTRLAADLRVTYPHLPVVVVSGLQLGAVAEDSWSIGAAAYFAKPFECDQVLASIRQLLAAPRRSPVRLAVPA